MPRTHISTPNLSIVNQHHAFLDGPDLLHDLVAPSSTAIAIDFLEDGSKRRKFSFKTLHSLSDALAQNILKSLEKLENASPVVPVFLPQCPELYIVILAILKAGKAFCPLSLDMPAERLDFILSDISANLIITDSAHGGNAAIPPNITKLQVDHELFQVEQHGISRSSHILTSELAYVLYTSGSTGMPKAVGVSHRAITQSLLSHDRHIPPFTRFLQFAAPTFDVSIFEIFFPWYRGRTLTCRTRARMLENLPETIRTLDVDAAELTPTVVSNLLEGRASVPSLRLLLTIGEMLTPDVIEEFGESDTRAGILWAMYGPTETAIHCTLQPRLSASASTGIIGFPLDTVSAFIVAPLSEDELPSVFSILPTGEEGELAIGGPQVAERYLNRPELTAASFLHHPKYGYIYRTGDRAKLCFDGTIECFGRITTGQVKLRGQRIELGEIEQTIMKVDGCRAATVIVVKDILVAFCATGSRKVLSADVIRTCKRWLPTIMVPSEVIFVHHIPQLPSGKTDRGSLAATFQQTLNHNRPEVTYIDDAADRTVVDMIQGFLRQELAPDSNLASAGLDSLQAIRIASKLRAEGHDLTALQILAAATLSDLLHTIETSVIRNGSAELIDIGSSEETQHAIPELLPRHAEIAGTFPCTPLQEAMLAETVARPKAYCNWIEIELFKAHTFEEIQTAIQRLAQENEILRSGFYPAAANGTTFVQVVWTELQASRICHVENFSRPYSLASYESLLQPLFIQTRTHSGTSRILFQIHHALYDGWSFDLLVQDLENLLLKQKITQRPQFSEVIRFFVEQRQQSVSTHEKYWTELLRDCPKTPLPNFHGKVMGNVSTCTFAGRSAVKLQTLQKHSRERMVGPQVYFQAATAWITSLYVGSSDVIIGNVTSGRMIPVPGIEEIIGPCISSLPFRLQFDDLATVEEILQETQRINRQSLEHSSLTLRDIAKAGNVPNGSRVFDVLFVWQQSLSSSTTPSKSTSIIRGADELEFKITLEFEPHSDHISYRATFDSSTISECQIQYFFQQIDAVVELFLKATDCNTSDISAYVSPNLCSIANARPSQSPITHGPSHAVEKWTLATPEKTALVFSRRISGVMKIESTLTYAELNARANQLASVLSDEGVRAGDLVAVIMQKSVDLYVTILAVLKLGAGYLPLVPDLPSERMKTILRDADVAACISDATSPTSLSQLTPSRIISLPDIDTSAISIDNIDTQYNGTHTAYAVFTSGSTGTPKGVVVTQENLMSNLSYLSSIYPYTSESRLLQSCSQAFDVSVFEIFFTWHVGICLCIAAKDDLFTDFEDGINHFGITHLSLTPTVAALVNPDNVPTVKFLVTAGEAVTEVVRRKWADRGLYQGYGPSETTNICTVRSQVSSSDLINNIGKPFENTSAFVLDPRSNVILPRGAVGELCFGGYQVFKGYLNQPDLTAEKIIDHSTYGRIYRSGDLGILLDDDSILFVGRMDDQVKIRGQRVEMGEVSSAVLDQECVRDCATLLLPFAQNSQHLVNFWVPATTRADTLFSTLDLRAFRSNTTTIFSSLSQRLPSYMVPSHLVPISRLPMTTQGKIDKRLLQKSVKDLTDEDLELATHPCDSDTGDETSITAEWEVQVAEILAETLGLSSENIKRNASFFNIGLDSVSAISFSNRMKRAYLGEFPISTILKNATIAQLAMVRETNTQINGKLSDPVLRVDQVISYTEISRIQDMFAKRDMPHSKIMPCTPLQEAMLAGRHSASESSYSNTMVFTVSGDLSRLQESWAMMFQRHEILRTSFVATDDPAYAFAQVVNQDTSINWGSVEWSGETHQHAKSMISSLIRENKPPVWLAIARAEDATRLLFCCHHAMYDGIAIQTLLKEVQEVFYHNELLQPISYEVFLQHILSQNLSQGDKFWTELYRGFEPASFPNLTEKASIESRSSASKYQQLRLPLSRALEACQNASVSLLSMIQATWAKLLHFYTGESDICFGNVVSGRSLAGHDLERLVAPCFNTVPVRIKFDFSNDNSALLQQLHATNVDSFGFHLVPLRRIQNIALKDGGRLFDTLVILQQPNDPLDSTIWTLEEDRGEMDLPLVCEISQDVAKDRLDLVLHYHHTIMSETEAGIVADTFEAVLAAMIDHPRARANDIIDLPPNLYAESNTKFSPVNRGMDFLHSGIEQVVETYPDQIALDFLHANDTRTVWSFQTLNERANDISHALMVAGVEPEDIVPIHLAKSPMFYASVLGVLKAGAAFAPIHPDLPVERRRFMLEELKASVIIHSEASLVTEVVDNVTLLDVETLVPSFEGNPTIQNLTSSNLAYCLFTSGSTGVPKAVSVEHRAPIQTIESSRSLVPWKASSRLLQYAAITFDMCYYDCFLAWTLGFTLCAAEQDLMLNDLSKMVNTLEVDLLDLTPSVAASFTRCEVPNVKWLYCIGEAMSPNIVKEWDGACVNSYGPTEAAFCTTIFQVSKAVKASIIGSPFPGTSFAVFSADGDQPLPLLSAGELYIGGAQLARGYLGNPNLTKEKFVTKNRKRYYRSGDIVRMLGDGTFEFMGRADDQVKIRGLRVELGEINVVLEAAHSDIITSITQIQKKDAAAKEQLVAYLVVKRDVSDENRGDIRCAAKQTARERLPSYMVPQFFLFVDQIPRSLAGKVDKKALADVFRRSADLADLSNGVSPGIAQHDWTTLENHVRDIFVQLSGSSHEDILPTTTIYQLGLDSISAVQIAAALRRHGYSVNATDVMKHLTCANIAECMERKAEPQQEAHARFDFKSFDANHRAHVVASCSVPSEDISAIYPCTPLQKGMISQILTKDGTIYINHIRLQLEASVDLNAMKQAWTRILLAHQMLRTGFAHLKDKQHPFGMIEYTTGAVNLPWEMPPDNRNSESVKTWLEKLQRKATIELHQPLWCIRIVSDTDTTYLDLAIFHALFDAQSLQFIFHDVTAAYKGLSLRNPAPIEPTIDEILERSKDKHDRGKHFWEQMGKQTTPCRFPNLAPLRYDPEPPVVSTYRSVKSLRNIEKACREANTTIQAVGLAGWLSLISAYTGESTATCGVVLSGRSFEAAEHAVFPCINTVPFAYSVTSGSRKMLNTVTSLIAEVQQHQHVPLNDIQRSMGFPNEAVFDTIFAYQKSPSMDNGSSLWRIVHESATTEYPVSIELEPKGDHMEYRLTAMPHVIPRKQAALILEQLDHLIQSFIFLTDSTDDSDNSLYSVTSAKESTLPSHARLLHDFVEITALEHPEHIALEFATTIDKREYSAQRWTYSELDNEGNKIANLLISHGVRPGGLIAVCFDKCPEASFAMLGVLKAGCAFVAIDPGAPAARQSYIIQDSGAAAVLSMTKQSAPFTDAVTLLVLDLDKIDAGSCSSTKPILEREIDQQDRSYCLYTSGTTGTPKGCELTHENAVQALLSFQRLFTGHWNTESRWLQFASFHFDVSVLEQYWSWSVGICVVSAPRDVIFEDLANSINTLGITHIDLTPSLAQILHPDDVPSLCKGVFITGGESLKQEILDVWGPKGVIYNGYGPTEATIGCTMYPRVPANGKPSNIGRQFENVGTFVLQPGTDVPVLRGAIGELCVSGKLVGKGYLNRKDLTEKSFPYLERFKERVYRTGDLVRILHDESFDFLGRADDQVKLRGQRLEIGEINSVIRKSDKNVSDVATLVLKHPRQQKEQLVAFVVQRKANGHSGASIDRASELTKVREACHDNLPPYMVPTHFIPMASLPLNVNNKADPKKLKELYEAMSAVDLQKLSTSFEEIDQSWSSQEMKLHMIVKGELDVAQDAFGKDTSFFELGMDSISVINVARAIKQAGFPSATASLVMTQSTLRRLTKALSAGLYTKDMSSLLAAQQNILAARHRHRGTVARSMAVNTSDIEALAPCTPLQQGMIARSLESEDRLYFNTFMFELSDTIDHNRLRNAWQEVCVASQILRTVFTDTEEGYVQAVLRNITIPWKVCSTTKLETLSDSLAGLRAEWLHGNQTAFKRPFEIVMLTAPGRKLLVVHIFHGLYDGISIDLIFNTVWNLYDGRQPNTDASTFHEALAHGPLRDLEGAKPFWQDHLSINAANSPLHISNDSHGTSVATVRELQAPDGFESMRRKLNVTAQAFAQACWLGVLQEHLKTTMTVGVVVSGRSIDLEGADRIVGPMFNTIPYRHRPQKSESWASIIKRVHDFNIAVHPYQHTPLRDIAKWCKIHHGQSLFDSLFVFQKTQDEEEWANNDAWQLIDGDATADFPLAFEIEQRSDDSWKLALVTQSHVLDDATSNELLDRFELLLHQAVTDSSAIFELEFETKNADKDIEKKKKKKQTNGSGLHTEFEWTDDAITLREAIADLTGSDLIQIDESMSIFELGLDSIDAIKLSSKLKRHGIQLPVSGIMRGLTIAKMLSHIQKSGHAKQEERSSITDFQERKHQLKDHFNRQNINTSQMEDFLPVTPLQEAMIAEMAGSEFARYYNFDVMELSQGTDIARLRNAWTQVVGVSPILRTSFVEIDDPRIDASYAQVVHALPYDFWTQRAMPHKPDFPMLFQEFRDEALQAPSSQPPFRTVLVESPSQVYLILCISHALYDGWSLGLLHADVKRAYDGQLEPRPDYQNTLAEIISTSGADATAFWQDYLFQVTPSAFTRQPHATGNLNRTVHHLERQSEQRTAALIRFAKKSNVSLQTLGQSVFAIVMASYIHSLDVCFGSVLSGRDDQTTSQLLFPTMNTVAIRTILHGTRLELMRHVQDSFANVKQWQHFPLRKALALANSRRGLFESLFIYQKAMDNSDHDVEQLYTSVEGHSEVEYPVCVEMEAVGDKLIWRCALRDEVFSATGAEELLGRLDRILDEIMKRPDEPVINFSSQGVSVCGLAPFQNGKENDHVAESAIFGNRPTTNDQPRSETVRAIREVLADVSGTPTDEIAGDMTIFHIGLDSISVIKVVSLLRRKDIILNVGEMLKAGTVDNMASIADARSFQPTHNVVDDTSAIDKVLQDVDHDDILRRAKIEGCSINDLTEAQILPATAGQIYMISMWLNTNGSNFYSDFTYHLTGVASFQSLQSAWKVLVAADPILRTYFVSTQNKNVPYVQLIHQGIEGNDLVIDVTGNRKMQFTRKISQPWAHLYVAQTETGWDLTFKIHHALYDGVSLPIIIQQFQDICNGDTHSAPSDIFARFIVSGTEPSALENRRLFWSTYLQGVGNHRRSQPTQSSPSTAFKTEIFKRSLISTKLLESFARQNGVSIQALFLAVYARLYVKFTRTPGTQEVDVVLGIYLANRSQPIPGIEFAAIPTINLVPLRVRSPSGQSVSLAAQQIQDDLQKIGEPTHSSTSLWDIHKWTGVKIDTFVNFLTWPEAQEIQGKSKEFSIEIKQTSQWEEGVNRVVESPTEFKPENEQHVKNLSYAEVNEKYLHAIDIEATVRDGGLDVGIFAPAAMVSLSEGNRWLSDLKLELEAVVC